MPRKALGTQNPATRAGTGKGKASPDAGNTGQGHRITAQRRRIRRLDGQRPRLCATVQTCALLKIVTDFGTIRLRIGVSPMLAVGLKAPLPRPKGSENSPARAGGEYRPVRQGR